MKQEKSPHKLQDSSGQLKKQVQQYSCVYPAFDRLVLHRLSYDGSRANMTPPAQVVQAGTK